MSLSLACQSNISVQAHLFMMAWGQALAVFKSMNGPGYQLAILLL